MVTVPEASRLTRRAPWALLAGVFLISFSLLAFEITLTRLLSVMLLYHYVFIVVSLALLGLGTGGIYVHFFRSRAPDGESQLRFLVNTACLVSLSIPSSVVLMVIISSIDFFRITLFLYCLLLFVPFFFAGMLFSALFRIFPEFSARLYGADLIGAAGGSLGIILLLDHLGGMTTSFFLGALVAASALLFVVVLLGRSLRKALVAIGSLLLTIILLTANITGLFFPEVPVSGLNPDKEMSRALTEVSLQGTIRESRWSAFGRTDLVEFPRRPGEMRLYVDGTAGTPMYRFNGNLNAPDEEVRRLKEKFTGYFPFFFLSPDQKNNALLIGFGGGRDILLALMGGMANITGVEVNRDIIDMVRDYSWYNGGITTSFNNVRVVAEEGRNFLRRQPESYDIIMLSLPVTQTSRSLEGFSLTENFLFTTESVQDYLDHLTEEGQLIIVSHDDVTTWKLLAISLAALEKRGVSQKNAMNQMYLLGLSTPGMYPLFVLKKTPFTPEEAARMHSRMQELGYKPILSFFPHIKTEGEVNPMLFALSQGIASFGDIQTHFAETLGIDIRPVKDNRPFFYKIETGLPFSVAIVLWLSALALALILAVPLLMRRQQKPAPANKLATPLPHQAFVLYAMIGIGFMLVEIALIQKFVLFLGQPVLSLASVLFSMLVGCGLGSFYSGRFSDTSITRRIATASLSVALFIGIYAILLPPLFHLLLGLPLSLRLLVTIALLLPLGFFMGQPFPLGIRWVKTLNAGSLIPWLWGINGVGSVLGSAATIALAISTGFTQALFAGASCYFIVLLAFSGNRNKNAEKLGK